MTTAGRPIRAFVFVMLGWTICRIAATANLPLGSPATMIPARQLYQRLTFEIPSSTSSERIGNIPEKNQARFPGLSRRYFQVVIPPSPSIQQADARTTGLETTNDHQLGSQQSGQQREVILSVTPTPSARTSNRWSMDAWALMRNGGSRNSLASYGQLGASQAGMRLQYDLTPGRGSRIALYSRLSSALDTPHASEAALGIAYRPRRSLPLDISVERRVSLGHGARNALAVVGTAGFGPSRMPLGLLGEGYAQAGLVGVKSKVAFVDGKISLSKSMLGDRVAIGLSASGGAQPHLSRLDIGPHIQMRFSTGKIQSRLAAEWRQRIAGRAQPGSGPAIIVSAGF